MAKSSNSSQSSNGSASSSSSNSGIFYIKVENAHPKHFPFGFSYLNFPLKYYTTPYTWLITLIARTDGYDIEYMNAVMLLRACVPTKITPISSICC